MVRYLALVIGALLIVAGVGGSVAQQERRRVPPPTGAPVEAPPIPAPQAVTCGPDPAPAPAAAQGYTCETFRWGSGDTASEIDSAQTYAATGFKWYWGTGQNCCNGHVTVASDYTVQAGTGKITIQTTEACPGPHCGSFSLNTCGGPPTGNTWTVGQYFQNGWYIEYVGEWNNTGHGGIQTGLYGLDTGWYQSGCPFGACWEIDDPDAFAFEQNVYNWHDGGSGSPQTITGRTFISPNIETGTDKWGMMSTATDVTLYVDHGSGLVANGTVTGWVGAQYGQAPQYVYSAKMCFGIESTSPFPFTLDSFKVWQTAPPSARPAAGGFRGLRGRH